VHLIAEGANLQLVQESSLGGFDLGACSDYLLVSDDFNLGLENLRLDVQLLEEAGLLGVKTSGTGADPHIIGGNSSNLSGCLTCFLVEDLLDV
jgi:NADH:ubiquinone oxidoreductase subunit F (NADH-binding)